MKDLLIRAAGSLIGVVAVLILLAGTFFFISNIGCMSAPEHKDYIGRPNSCYDFADCLYRNKDNPDKSVCVDLSKECRAIERFEYCKNDNMRPEKMDFEKCWLYLNQK